MSNKAAVTRISCRAPMMGAIMVSPLRVLGLFNLTLPIVPSLPASQTFLGRLPG